MQNLQILVWIYGKRCERQREYLIWEVYNHDEEIFGETGTAAAIQWSFNAT